jgi:hypothetical protein
MNWANAFATAGVTAGFGFIAFVLGQLVLTLVVEPVQEQARIVGEVTHALTYYRNVGSETSGFGPGGIAEARRTYRDLAARLRMNIRVLRPWYRVFARPPFVLPAENVRCAAAALIVLSTTVKKGPAAEDVRRSRAAVRKSLDIES